MSGPLPEENADLDSNQLLSIEEPVSEDLESGRSLWKVWSLVVLFFAFLAFVIFFVYPNQEGILSSTSLQHSALLNVSSAYNETLPIQDVGINNQGRSMFIAFVMLTHVLFASIQLGEAG